MTCRTIYAVLITIYAPFMSWLLATKCSCAKGESFLALTLQYHGKTCPVLFAWGWKDFASELDIKTAEDNGKTVYDELVVAGVLTVLVVGFQTLPCFAKMKSSDTLLARYVQVAGSLSLTLGYVWNMVATIPLTKIQEIHPPDHFSFYFMTQAYYALIVAILATIVGGLLSDKPKAVDTHEHLKEEHQGPIWHTVFAAEGILKQTILQVWTFIYAWGFLDTLDDWAFGVMFHCTSNSRCSYQSNFVYALSVTCALVTASAVLDKCKQFTTSPGFKNAATMQSSAMLLTVGWAWMNSYSTYLSAITKPAKDEGTIVTVYVKVLAFVFVIANIIHYVFAKTELGLARYHKEMVADLKQSV
jgi:hypothetical protein